MRYFSRFLTVLLAGVLVSTAVVGMGPAAAQTDSRPECTPGLNPGLTVVQGSSGEDKVEGVAGVAELFLLGDGDDEVKKAGDGDVVCFTGGKNQVEAEGSGTVNVFGGPGEDKVDFKDDVGGLVDLGDGKGEVKVESGPAVVVAGDGDLKTDLKGVFDYSVTAGNGDHDIKTGSGADSVVVGDGESDIETGAGDDSVTAGAGKHDIKTEDGADRVVVGVADDSKIDTGDGDDYVRFAGEAEVKLGKGDDVADGSGATVKSKIEGEDGSDVLVGGAGGDELKGGKGNDFIFGGPGVDKIDGNENQDECFSGEDVKNCEVTGASPDTPSIIVLSPVAGELSSTDSVTVTATIVPALTTRVLVDGTEVGVLDSGGTLTVSGLGLAPGAHTVTLVNAYTQVDVGIIASADLEIIAPTEGDAVASDSFDIAVTVDPAGQPIGLSIDGTSIGEATAPGYVFTAAGLDLAPGSHIITATTPEGRTAEVTVIVPELTLTVPAEGDLVEPEGFTVTAGLAPAAGDLTVTVDGVEAATLTGPGYTVDLTGLGLEAGDHEVAVSGFGFTETVTVTVPEIVFIVPAPAAVIAAETLTVELEVTPAAGPVEIAIDGEPVGTVEAPDYEGVFDGLALTGGTHVLTASGIGIGAAVEVVVSDEAEAEFLTPAEGDTVTTAVVEVSVVAEPDFNSSLLIDGMPAAQGDFGAGPVDVWIGNLEPGDHVLSFPGLDATRTFSVPTPVAVINLAVDEAEPVGRSTMVRFTTSTVPDNSLVIASSSNEIVGSAHAADGLIQLDFTDPGLTSLKFSVVTASGEKLAAASAEFNVEFDELSFRTGLEERYEQGDLSSDEYFLLLLPLLTDGAIPVEPGAEGADDEATLEVFELLLSLPISPGLRQTLETQTQGTTDQSPFAAKEISSTSGRMSERSAATKGSFENLVVGDDYCDGQFASWIAGGWGPVEAGPGGGLFISVPLPRRGCILYASGTEGPFKAVYDGLTNKPDNPVRIKIHLMDDYRPDELDENNPNGSKLNTVPDELDELAANFWKAQAQYGDGMGLRLPDGVVLNGVFEDTGDPLLDVYLSGEVGKAFSQPWGDHPIKLDDRHIDSGTLVHELFHTYQWADINYVWEASVDAIVGGSLPAVSMIESTANWGTIQVGEVEGVDDWTQYGSNDANEVFLSRPDLPPLQPNIDFGGINYSFFPVFEWFDNHAPEDDIVDNAPDRYTEVVPEMIAGWNPVTSTPFKRLDESLEGGRFEALGGPHELSRAWPRMWMALLLSESGDLNGPLDIPESRWTRFWQRDPDPLVPPTPSVDTWDSPPREIIPFLDPAGPLVLGEPAIYPGGAKFYTIDSLPDIDGTITVTSSSPREEIELAVLSHNAGNPESVCVPSTTGVGEHAVSSDVFPAPVEGFATISMPHSQECAGGFSIAVVHVNPERGNDVRIRPEVTAYFTPGAGDSDGDGVADDIDNCLGVSNPAPQRDLDGDGLGDACDGDRDGDSVRDVFDSFDPTAPVDNCIDIPNPGQDDLDDDDIGDACDEDIDGDGFLQDGIPGPGGTNISKDNCPLVANDQTDSDSDGTGDACEVGLSVDVTVSPSPPVPGGRIVITSTVRNPGADSFPGGVLSVQLPAGVNNSDWQSDCVLVEAATRTYDCVIGAIEPGGDISVVNFADLDESVDPTDIEIGVAAGPAGEIIDFVTEQVGDVLRALKPCLTTVFPACLFSWAWGDPHLTTFDRVAYDFQSAGEFVHTEAVDGSWVVQVRQEPWGGSGRVSVNTAVVADLGGTVVEVRKDGTVLVDGARGPALVSNSPADLGGGAALVRSGSRFEVWWPGTGDSRPRLDVTVNRGHLSIGLAVPASLAGQVQGIYGNADGDRSNDFAFRYGEVLEAVPSTVLYGPFTQSWRIDQSESLFTYADGESTATFTDVSFPRGIVRLTDFAPAVLAEAEAVCRAAGVTDQVLLDSCILDIAVTGDISFVTGAVGATTPASGSSGVYLEDFEDGDAAGFSAPLVSVSDTGLSFNGPLPATTNQLLLGDLPPHDEVTLSYDLHIIGEWDGDDGPDAFSAQVDDGPSLLDGTFSNTASTQTYPAAGSLARAGLLERDTLGGSTSTTYRLTQTFPHWEPDLTIDFSATGSSAVDGEFWGLDNVEVIVNRLAPRKFAYQIGATVAETIVRERAENQHTFYVPAGGLSVLWDWSNCFDGVRTELLGPDGQPVRALSGCRDAYLTLAEGVHTVRVFSPGAAVGDYTFNVAPSTVVPQTYSTTITDDNPVLYERFENSTGSATVTYPTTTTTGTTGALLSEPISAAITAPPGSPAALLSDNGLSSGGQDRSIEFWHQGSGGGRQWLVEYGNGFGLIADGDSQIEVLSGGNIVANLAPPPGVTLNDDLWHHYVLTYDGTRLDLYFDGALLGGVAIPVNTGLTGQLTVGGHGGSYDEIAVFDRALQEREISDHYANAANPAGLSCPSIAEDAYGATVLADGPSLYYRPGDDQTSNRRVAYEYSGGCLAGSLTTQTSIEQSALPASNNPSIQAPSGSVALTTPTEGLPSGSEVRSVEFWHRGSGGGRQWLVEYGNGFGLIADGDSQIEILSESVIRANVAPPVGVSLNDGEWHHFVLTYDGARLDLYFDGALLGGVNIAVDTFVGKGLFVGRHGGSYDEVAVYPVALSQVQISKHWAAGRSETGTVCAATATDDYGSVVVADGALGFWRLDDRNVDGSVSRVAFDTSGNCRAGSILAGGTPVDSPVGGGIETVPGPVASVVPSDLFPAGGQDRSIEFWHRGSGGGRQWLVEYGNGFGLIADGDSQIEVLSEGGIRANIAPPPGVTLNDDLWHHYVLTVKDGRLDLYFDGVLLGGVDHLSVTTIEDGLFIGRHGGAYTAAAVYPTALTPQQINNHHTLGTP